MDDDATTAFIAKVGEINTLVKHINTLASDHFNVNPDGVTWSHVGQLASVLTNLNGIMDIYPASLELPCDDDDSVEEPHCTNCGFTHLVYQRTTATSKHYLCDSCGEEETTYDS